MNYGSRVRPVKLSPPGFRPLPMQLFIGQVGCCGIYRTKGYEAEGCLDCSAAKCFQLNCISKVLCRQIYGIAGTPAVWISTPLP